MTQTLLPRWRIVATTLLAGAALATLGAVRPEAWTQPARYKFEYKVDFAPAGISQTAALRVWLPYPAEMPDQKTITTEIDSPWPYSIKRDSFGNQMVYLEGQGVPARPVTMRFVVERRPSEGMRPAEITANSPSDPQRYLHSDKLIPLDGMIGDLAVQESKGRTSDAEKVRAFYDYVVKTLSYNKEGTGWGRGDAIWACTNKRGNCTDFHSLFMGMARSQGIPARFMIGFPIPGDGASGVVSGYHCWAEFYDKTRGWVPIDASEANKSGQADAYFGKLPADRIQFIAGRDLVLVPPQRGEPLNYFIYPYAEADGAAVNGINATFHFERLTADAGSS